MVLENFTEIFNLIANPNSILEGLKTSQLGTESHFGLLFGFFFIYFFVTKANKKFTIWAFVFLIIAFKRIAIAASILSVIIYLIYRNSKFTKSVKLNANLLMFFSLMLFMFLLINLSLGVYDTWIKDNIGLSANHFTMGRAQMYKRVLENLEVGFIGTGQGTVTEFLEGLNFKKMNRLHSDFLRNHIEIGFGFYTIWILLFNKLNIFNLKALVILVYYWVVLVTDNAFIYFDFLALFYMIQTIFYEEK
ncbi:hypothetical protein [Winogradskyella poriferorum]|uniref:hypothetical protein n=1 Tax=Winogradskyella poriferorum TaxID=307627 RepID=UPI003D647DD8